MFFYFSGNHDELIKNPDGAYSQLVRLQEGAQEDEEGENLEMDNAIDNVELDRVMSTSEARRSSVSRSMSRASSRSISRVSSSTRHRPSVNSGLPVQVDENQSGERGDIEEAKIDNNKKKNFSVRRLAYLNKPEIPILLLGSIAAAVHGVIFPVFGLLLSSAISMLYKPPAQMRKESRFWGLLYVGLGAITLVFIPMQNYFFGIAGGKLIERIRSLTFEKIVHQEIGWFDDPTNSR